MVAEGDRLGGLEMREARHHGVGMGEGPLGQGELEVPQPAVDGPNRLAHPKLEIERHLVVAGPGRMKPPGGLADQFAEARLDVHVDVFERPGKGEAARLDFARHTV